MMLLRAIASCLEMEEIAGMRTIVHIPADERQRLADERERTAEMLAHKVSVMTVFGYAESYRTN